MDVFDLIVVGGGAAGFMAAITAASNSSKRIKILESSSRTLEKVRISGGGRCNVTNASWIPQELIENYPRGEKKLIESFSRFAAGDVYEWFQKKGVKLKIENDQRVFPESNSSMEIVNCLRQYAQRKGILISTNNHVKSVAKNNSNFFEVFTLKHKFICRKLLIATGGHRSGYRIAESLGHQIIKPVPSLFSLTCKSKFLKDCIGVSIKNIDLKIIVNDRFFENRGDLLITHWGFSGPGVLKLSAQAARELYETKYNCLFTIKWSNTNLEDLENKINSLRHSKGKSNLHNSRPLTYLTKRLWIQILNKLKININKTWSQILSSERDQIVKILMNDTYKIEGKGPFGEEFVTAGGVAINEVNFKTMQSCLCKDLFFAGEILDVDGITGGFNFQHCWTSGWLAGQAILDNS